MAHVRAPGVGAIVEDVEITVCVGVAAWKRDAVSRLLAPDTPSFTPFASRAVQMAKARGGAIGVWPSRAPKGLESLARRAGVPLARIEDGFIRSSGLGAECRPPASIVVDRTGIYFDPGRPSDLELLLTHAAFDAALTTRAQRLIDRVVALGVTKYNLAGKALFRPIPTRAGARTVLVIGQVEDDLSVRLGGAGVAGNLDLLRRVRALEPEAIVLYRPHPDVEGGHRKGALRADQVLGLADHLVTGDVSLPRLLESVQAVHVLTSLTGFEALLRGLEVIVHGQPFYAGWGLTRDLAPPPRRGRKLSVAQLAAGALILYPRYLDPQSGQACSPEALVERLAEGQGPPPSLLPAVRRMQGQVRRLADAVAL